MRFKQTLGAVAAAAAVGSVAAGCTSQPAGGIEAPAAAAAAGARYQAAAARYQATSTLRTIYDRWLYGARIGYATSLDGSFQACPDSSSQLSYYGEMKLYPLGGKVSGAAFTRRITGALRRDGWRVYPQKFITVAPPERVYSYAFTEGGTGGCCMLSPVSGAWPAGRDSSSKASASSSQCRPSRPTQTACRCPTQAAASNLGSQP